MTRAAATGETILVLGNYRPCLAMARALAGQGRRIMVSRGLKGEFCEHSRFVTECWDHPPLEQEHAFFAALGELLRARQDISTVFPIWEPALLGFERHKHLLPRGRTYVLAEAATIALCLDKTRMLQLSARIGLPGARSAVVRDHDGLIRAGENIGYPLVVRPGNAALRIGERKAVIAQTRQQLAAELDRWPQGHEELIVQRFVDGHRVNLYFAARDGQPIRYLPAQILKTDIDDGTGLATDGVTLPLEPELRRMADALIAHLSFHGVGCIQFMRDRASGAYSFLELNPRIAGNHAVAEACGMELTRLAIELARGGARNEPLRIGPAGRRYAWSYGELSALRKALSAGDIGPARLVRGIARALAAGWRADIHITWRRDDPLPTLMVFARQVPAILRVVGRALVGRLGRILHRRRTGAVLRGHGGIS